MSGGVPGPGYSIFCRWIGSSRRRLRRVGGGAKSGRRRNWVDVGFHVEKSDSLSKQLRMTRLSALSSLWKGKDALKIWTRFSLFIFNYISPISLMLLTFPTICRIGPSLREESVGRCSAGRSHGGDYLMGNCLLRRQILARRVVHRSVHRGYRRARLQTLVIRYIPLILIKYLRIPNHCWLSSSGRTWKWEKLNPPWWICHSDVC